MSDASKNTKTGNAANTVLLGMLILICSCALIIAVRLHDRMTSLTEQVKLLNEGNKVAAPMPSTTKTPAVTPAPTTRTDTTKPDEPPAVPQLVTRPRSPLPQPGEEIVKPLPATQLVTGTPDPVKAIAPPPAAGTIIAWSKAHEHLEQEITVEGKIVATKNIGNYCFLNFTDEPRGGDRFHLIIYKEAFTDFGGKPEDELLNKTLRVTGKVEMDPKGERPQIRIKSKEQVKVVE
ncbi:MAG: hypothetical protein WD768_05750 [Phycisphaeraceae bacterium]